MSDDTLREKIVAVIADDGWQAETFGDRADEVIELVREALLAPEVVRAGARAITSDPAFADNTWVDDARNTLTAALGAAGLGGDGHE